MRGAPTSQATRRSWLVRRGPPPLAIDSPTVAGRTQELLYSDIDLELSWSEDALPQVLRTKHVHSLHPYLGKFVPQLVEVFLDRYFEPGECVYDPFVGSGTTLVEANTFGCAGIGCDVSAFNCLLSDVKTENWSLGLLELGLKGALEAFRRLGRRDTDDASEWLQEWYSEGALGDLLAYRDVIRGLDPSTARVAKVILSRAARSARLTTHFDLDFPKAPVRDAYFCHKHKRTCRPVQEAGKFLVRYTLDTVRRLRDFSLLRQDRRVEVLHGDARRVELPLGPSGIITSPPYPGLIDYHEQHRYAYELLGLEDRRCDEIGTASKGRSRSALSEYRVGMIEVFKNAAAQMSSGSTVVVVVNDSKDVYPAILDGAGLVLQDRLTRHVNRRTGRRAGEFYEDVLVARTS